MRTTTTAALAAAGATLALTAPAFAKSRTTDERAVLRAPMNAKAQMHAARRMHRIETRARNRRRARGATTPGYLAAIAACESGGNPATNTGNGFYGKYQFDLQTWASVGGKGLPSNAGEAEQDRRAAILYARSGATPWPVCGR